MKKRVYQDELAQILGVEVRTLREWRQSDLAGTKRYLPAHRDSKTSRSYYFLDEVLDWAENNSRYLNAVFAKLTQDSIETGQMRLPEPEVLVSELRGIEPEVPITTTAAWANAFDNYQQENPL